MDVEAEFKKAVDRVHNLPSEKETSYTLPVSLKLKFYALYKQATEGKCNIAAPPFYNPIARTKWSAWNNLGDMTKEEAMQEYCQHIRDTETKYKQNLPL